MTSMESPRGGSPSLRPPHSPQRPPSLLEIKELLMSGSEPEHAKARGAGPASASAAPSPSQHAATQPPAAAGDLQSQTKSPAPRIVRRASLRLSSMKSLSGGSRASDGASGASDAGLSSARVHQPLAETASPEQRRLEKRCAKAVHLLEQLQQQAMGVRPGAAGAEPLPPAALACCKGLVFARQRKAGLLGSFEWGHGFILRRFPDGTWSAPCFLRQRYAGLGLTLGLHTISSISVLQDEAQLWAFAEGHAGMCVDASLPSAVVDPLDPTDPAVWSLRHAAASLPPDVVRPRMALVSRGLIYDISVKSGVSYTDEALNASAYSSDSVPVSAQQVLSGMVDPPREFLPLYRALCDLAGNAQLTRRTASRFELERERLSRPTSSLVKSLSWGSKRWASTAASDSGGGTLHRSSSRTSLTRNSLAGGSPTSTLPLGGGAFGEGSLCSGCGGGGGGLTGGGGGSGAFKLFGDVDIGFVERHSFELQELEEDAEQQQQQQQQQRQPAVEEPPPLFG